MTTTDKFQIYPDYYDSEKECKIQDRKRNDWNNKEYTTNSRYNFKHTHFTAGDESQFELYRDSTNGKLNIDVDLKNNIYNNLHLYTNVWSKYTNLNCNSVDNTFKYMVNKFKKGIFVKIKNGKLRVFLPFSKYNFKNEWSHTINMSPKEILIFYENLTIQQGYKFNPRKINTHIDNWYCNNCLVRNEFPINESDTNVPEIRDMLLTLCNEREISDMEFFINKRDFPILSKDETEAYDDVFGDNIPLVSHNYEKYLPILSMVTTANNADIAIPTPDDWAMISRTEGKYFASNYERSFLNNNEVEWKDKIPTAVFRGSSTGRGVTVETNPRLKLVKMSYNLKRDNPDEKFPLLDAKITSWNNRPRKLKNSNKLQIIDIENIGFKVDKNDFLTPKQQCSYKYLINVDGHVSAYRLSLELSSGCCLLIVKSKYKMWFTHMLKEYIHYVPVNDDLSNLIEQIKWCRNNDEKCKKISINAKQFSEKYLSKQSILDYLQKILYEIKNVNGVYIYNTISPVYIQYNLQNKILKRMIYNQNINIENINISKFRNNSEYFKIINVILDISINQEKINHIIKDKKVIFKNKNSIISEVDFKGISIIKKSQHITNNESLIHEMFIGKILNKYIDLPNFVHIFNTYQEHENINLLQQNVDNSITLLEYIKSHFNFETYLNILLQISLALQIAQDKCGFVHNDLTPWNIILQKYKYPVTIKYNVSYNKTYSIKSNIIPVIIDYEKSHIIYKGYHYGKVNMFSTSTIQDILTILSTTIYELTYLENVNLNKLVYLSNFITNTKYCNQQFKINNNPIGNIRYFFGKTKKFSELISSEKYELENFRPLDFVNYILNEISPFKNILNIDTEYSIEYKPAINHIFTHVLENVDLQLKNFTDIFDKILNFKIEQRENVFLSYYIGQKLLNECEHAFTNIKKILKGNDIDIKPYHKKYVDTVSYIKSSIDLDKHHENILYNVLILPEIKFNEKSFLHPQYILKEIDKIKIDNKIISFVEYKNIIELVLNNKGYYKLGDEIKKHYEKVFENILKLDVSYLKKIADINTIQYLSKHIYKSDLEFLLEQKYPEIDVYKKILQTSFSISEIKGDLFTVDKSYSLAHCVAVDLNMGAGIAVEFKKRFGQVDNLKNQKKFIGDVAFLKDKDRYIFYLVTKQFSRGKPTYDSLKQSLEKMKILCIEYSVKKIAIPKIGCGLDRLDWIKVKKIIIDVFTDTDINIVVYIL